MFSLAILWHVGMWIIIPVAAIVAAFLVVMTIEWMQKGLARLMFAIGIATVETVDREMKEDDHK